MSMRTELSVRGVLLCACCFLAAALPSLAQNGSVTGIVLNPKGETVAGAKVILANDAIGVKAAQTTDKGGRFTFVNVPPRDTYTLTIEAAGFNPYLHSPVKVRVAGSHKIIPVYQVTPERTPPTPDQRLDVEAEMSPLEFLSTTMSGFVDNRSVLTLPLVGRDFIDLALLVPGTYPVEQGSALEGAALVANGARANMNNFLLDGTDNNDYTINQSLPFQIVEAMQEFRVQTSVPAAEYGRSAGAQINVISRKGENTPHGTLFGFSRNSALSAGQPLSAYNGGTFDQYAGAWKLQPGNQGKPGPLGDTYLQGLYERRDPRVVQNQFGANLGGKLAENRLFYFLNWESFRVSNPRPLFERVPGMFLRGANPTFRSLVNFSAPQNPAAAVSQLYGLYPLPNVGPSAFTDANYNAFWVGESANWTATDNWLERLDWRIGSHASMNFKHNIQRINQVQGGTLPQTTNYPGNGNSVKGRNQNFSYNWVQQIGDRTSQELRAGWNRFRLTVLPLDSLLDPSSLSISNVNFHDRGLPTVTATGQYITYPGTYRVNPAYTQLGPLPSLGGDFNSPSARANSTISLADNLGYTRGRHSAKFGFELRHARLNINNEAFGRGQIVAFSGPYLAYWNQPDLVSIARVDARFGGGFDRAFSTRSYSGFVQDQWQAGSLTFNYGLRYEVNTAPVELRDRLVNYYPALGGLVRAGTLDVLDPFGNVISQAPGAVPRAGFDTGKKNFSPRAGFAWALGKSSKTVLRGGYAMMYDQQPFQPSVNMLLNPPFVSQDFALGGPAVSFSTSFQRKPTLYTLPYSITARDPQTRTAYLHQFHFGLERALGRGLIAISYVGSLGRRLPLLRDISACAPDRIASETNYTSATSCVGAANQLYLYDLSQAGFRQQSAANRFLGTRILNQESTGLSSFNSLQVRLETASYHGSQLRLHYQWAKSIDNASSLQPNVSIVSAALATLTGLGLSEVTNSQFASADPGALAGVRSVSPSLTLRPALPVISTRPGVPQNSSNMAGERGLSDFDVRHRAVIHYLLDIPRRLHLGPGWQLAGITTLQTGQPYSVYLDYFGVPLRPDISGAVLTSTSDPNAAINGGLPITQGNFLLVNALKGQTPGALGRNALAGPNLVNFDASALKTFKLRSDVRRLEFRAEFFNLLNRSNYRQPYGRGGALYDWFNNVYKPLPAVNADPLFGRILQARPAREIQFAAKLIF
jgi:hypothetical protein